MDAAIIIPFIAKPTAGERPRISWTKRTIPLTNSTLFKKVKHSQEWHREVEATTGKLHPSDPQFPWGFVRNHTDTYLKKKGKNNQEDTDVRLSELVQTHRTRDVAIASVAHAMTAQSLSRLLLVETNVMYGSYWGLDTWLQSLIAANRDNPPSTTRLEAQWARLLLPYATVGASAAGYYLQGITRALEEFETRNMQNIPGDFTALLCRAMKDYGAQLEGLRLTCDWAAAKEAVDWMTKLDKSSPLDSSGTLRIEAILDEQFPTWRMWASWRPDVGRIARLSKTNSTWTSTILDLLALEGPDLIKGTEGTLLQGLIADYSEQRRWIRYRGLVIEVPELTRVCLSAVLERLLQGLDTVSISTSNKESLFNLFRSLTISQTITKRGLDLFKASLDIAPTPNEDCFTTIRKVWSEKEHICGIHLKALQQLICILEKPEATTLREHFLHDWLFHGFEECFSECQSIIREQINNPNWLPLLLELHTFCTAVKASTHVFPQLGPKLQVKIREWPSEKRMTSIEEIYIAAQNARFDEVQTTNAFVWVDPNVLTGSVLSRSGPEDDKARHSLELIIEKHCLNHLLDIDATSHTVDRALRDILEVWESTMERVDNSNRRTLAILVSRDIVYSAVHRCECILELAVDLGLGQQSTLVEDMVHIVRTAENDPRRAIVALTNILANRKGCTQCWRALLYRWLDKDDKIEARCGTPLVDYLIQTMDTRTWLSFMQSLETLFEDQIFYPTEEHALPSLLEPQLLSWVSRMDSFSRTLTLLEDLGGNPIAVRSILSSSKEPQRTDTLAILSYLQTAEGNPSEAIMQRTIIWLSGKRSDMHGVKECLHKLLGATHATILACQEIFDAKFGFLDIPGLPTHEQASLHRIIGRDNVFHDGTSEQYKAAVQLCPSTLSTGEPNSHHVISRRRYDTPLAVAEVMVAGWMQDNDVKPEMKAVIGCFARLFNLEVYSNKIPETELLKAITFWDGIEAEIMREADRLEGLKRTLKAKDRVGTALLLEEYDVPDTSLLEEEILGLPAGVIDLVELISDDEIEMSFSLASYTDLQRNAMGIPSAANNLIIRLYLDRYGKKPPRFCTHYDSETDLETTQHLPWISCKRSHAPHEYMCFSPQSAFMWQLNRLILRHTTSRDVTIAEFYPSVQSTIREMGRMCICCGVNHEAENAQLRRSTPCSLVACAQLWYSLPLEIRIPEIRTDIFAVDMLLSSVYNAACTGSLQLLPGCPVRTASSIKAILNSLPKLSVIRDAVHISRVLEMYHGDAEKLISWACTQFRGYIATASGLCKIKNLPTGTHQFVLANASPKLESSYLSRLPKSSSETTVLFHGTSLDRLPAILAQGLVVCSGTTLERTGAAYGKGIYLPSRRPCHFLQLFGH
ncbi:hypothetical protein G6011_00474 [Alternaria panax]|uniref:PARP catalytic domain-containing protein n=1 Tax=Alternaria panax TaxID=48097 RepID=A0AAD4NV13_9PLEO|nr:hypothetical protein G6011_00474 [Alternaria panax]